MAGAGGGERSRDLNMTPTWAVAVVCAVIVLISFFLEKILLRLGQWFIAKHKKALYDALEKIKSELMVLGFISFLLTFGQNYIAKICIPYGLANTMLPCALDNSDDEEKQSRRRLLWNYNGDSASTRRSLAESTISSCPSGKVSFVSENGLHQLHIFIFFLAVFHVVSSALTMALGRMKIRRWKEWEMETQTLTYEFSYDPSRFRLAREISFVREHTSLWDRHPILLYFVCFFHQFLRSVRKADYLTLRHGFINVHLASGSKFNFQKYIKKSLEDDYKNAFQLTYFFWIWYDFGLRSCFHQNFGFIVARIFLGLIIQFMCCYITLPLYALVSQMGSHMKRSIFDEQTNQALKKWHRAIRKRHKKGPSSCSNSAMASPSSSPGRLPHSYFDSGFSDRLQTIYFSDKEIESPVMKRAPRSFTNMDYLDAQIDSFVAPEIKADELSHHVEEEKRDEDFTFC